MVLYTLIQPYSTKNILRYTLYDDEVDFALDQHA
jgi:hypothetical protein